MKFGVLNVSPHPSIADHYAVACTAQDKFIGMFSFAQAIKDSSFTENWKDCAKIYVSPGMYSYLRGKRN